MFAQPGKKMLFMGAELAQCREWNHDRSLDWHLLDDPRHEGIRRLVEDLNRLYRSTKALHELDCEPAGFAWIDCNDVDSGVISFLRRGRDPQTAVCVVCNFTNVPHQSRRVGVPFDGHWREIMNSDATLYGGSGWGNLGGVDAAPVPMHGQRFSIAVTLPPLGIVFLEGGAPSASK
jgi:1,4-alpha-glucan branching enzyme